ncbi:MAG: YcxB family protein [Armatimonadetes bacterium]|nr:YcxB family protein [Armatimonadota bacterium]
MTIRYDYAPDDVVAFNEWFVLHAVENRKQLKILRVVLAVLSLLCVGAGLVLRNRVNTLLIIEGIFLALFAAFFQKAIIAIARKQAAKIFSDPGNANLFGEVTLDISPQEIIAVSANSTASYRWNLVSEVITTPEHLFLKIGTRNAIMVARRKVASGDFESFAAEAKRLHRAASDATPQPIGAR